jgi:hypothetical protein
MSRTVRVLGSLVGIALFALTGCAHPTTAASPPPSTTPPSVTSVSPTSVDLTSAPPASPSSSSAAPGAPGCALNPTSAPVPTADPYEGVPRQDQISVRVDGIAPGLVLTAGGPPVEFAVTLCNSSPVSYPVVGVVVALDHCDCAPAPLYMPTGEVQRQDPATGAWQSLGNVRAGNGMDYLGLSTDQAPLPRGASATYRFRVSLAASTHPGKGGIQVVAVSLPGPIGLGQTDTPVTVRTTS